MIKYNLQFFGGRGSAGGNKPTSNASSTPKAKTPAKKTRTPKEPVGTMATNKSFEQIQSEVQQLQDLPAGSRIERIVDGKPVTYIAHDRARTGRNGRMLRQRVFSEPTNETFRNGMSKLVKNTTDPYSIAQGQWRKRK